MRNTGPCFFLLMSTTTFYLRICLVTVLLGLPVYGCLRQQEAITLARKAERTCLQALQRSTRRALTVVGQADAGHLVHQRTTDATALAKLRRLANGLRPALLPSDGYRSSLRHYTLVVASERDSCDFTVYKMPVGTADLFVGVGDSVYEAPQFIPFLDSLFRSIAPKQGRMRRRPRGGSASRKPAPRLLS